MIDLLLDTPDEIRTLFSTMTSSVPSMFRYYHISFNMFGLHEVMRNDTD